MASPVSAISVPATALDVMPWRTTARAPAVSPPPSRCATCTEKPMVSMEHTPQNSHRLLFIRPTDALASAPRRPTIEASIYCITMVDSCAIIAGAARRAASES